MLDMINYTERYKILIEEALIPATRIAHIIGVTPNFLWQIKGGYRRMSETRYKKLLLDLKLELVRLVELKDIDNAIMEITDFLSIDLLCKRINIDRDSIYRLRGRIKGDSIRKTENFSDFCTLLLTGLKKTVSEILEFIEQELVIISE